MASLRPGLSACLLRQLSTAKRILPAAIVREFTLLSSGAYEPLAPESTKPIAHLVRHAGIVKVLRYTFTMESPRQATSALRGKPEMLGSVRGFPGLTRSRTCADAAGGAVRARK